MFDPSTGIDLDELRARLRAMDDRMLKQWGKSAARMCSPMPEPIIPTEYRAFQKAYDFFNAELFSGALPHVLVTLQRRARSSGYFAPERFA
jgi:hypothetical protein